MRKFMPVMAAVLLSACARPSDGPSAGSFYNATAPGTGEQIPVTRLAEVSPSQLAGYAPSSSTSGPGLSVFRSAGYADTRLRRGDVIDVTIFDTGEDGLFSSASSKTLNLGRFTVDSSGSVTMPYVGKQRVLESSPEALQSRIVAGLKGSAVNPQAVVTVVERPGNGVTVSGLVRTPGRIALSARKERVLDAVASAGGASAAPGATTVTLVRGKMRASTSLERVQSEDAQNVYLLPDDQLLLEDAAPSFTVMGAFKSTGEFKFEPGRLTLAQALGRAGGLLDDRADASNVYVLRRGSTYPSAPGSDLKAGGAAMATKPAIFRADLKDVANLALMQQFRMMDGDILYASNSGMVDFAKLFTIYQKSPTLPAAAPPAPAGQ